VFVRSYLRTLIGSWPARFLLGVPTVIGIAGAIFSSGDPWQWIALVLAGVVLVQTYVAYKAWSPIRPAIRAVREEIEYIRRRLAELKQSPAIASLSTPILPATEWNKYKDLLREQLDREAYKAAFDFFDAADRFNRQRQQTTLTPDPVRLSRKLEAADAALARQFEPRRRP